MISLIADIGATNARFALTDGDGAFRDVQVLQCSAYPTVAEAAAYYLKGMNAVADKGFFSIAAPLTGGDQVSMTNHGWSFSIADTAASLNLSQLDVVNDFTAIALGVPHLAEGRDYHNVGPGVRQKGAPIALIGPGTGLGVAGIVFDVGGAPIVVPSEGGHVTLPVQTEREYNIVAWLLQNKYSHVSAERVVSGKGLINLYLAICGLDDATPLYTAPADIMAAGMKAACPQSAEAVDLFCHWLGTVAGNLALSYGAFGGVFIAGGIVPSMGPFFAQSRFRESFLAKGRYRAYLDRIATSVITHPQPGLAGLASKLAG